MTEEENHQKHFDRSYWTSKIKDEKKNGVFTYDSLPSDLQNNKDFLCFALKLKPLIYCELSNTHELSKDFDICLATLQGASSQLLQLLHDNDIDADNCTDGVEKKDGEIKTIKRLFYKILDNGDPLIKNSKNAWNIIVKCIYILKADFIEKYTSTDILKDKIIMKEACVQDIDCMDLLHKDLKEEKEFLQEIRNERSCRLIKRETAITGNNHNNNTMDTHSLDYIMRHTDKPNFCFKCHIRRKDVPNNKMLRCSRCKLVCYCSQVCQKAHFSLHKSTCRKLANLQQEDERLRKENIDASWVHRTSSGSEESKPDLLKSQCGYLSRYDIGRTYLMNKYELAHDILDLTFQSTDTVDNGKFFYQLALKEFYEVMRLDPFYPSGALESTVIILALLGYDCQCISLIQFLLDPNKYGEFDTVPSTDDRVELIRLHHNNTAQTMTVSSGTDQYVPYQWIYRMADVSSLRQNTVDNRKLLKRICDLNSGYHWNTNVFLVPLMLIQMRNMCRLKIQQNEGLVDAHKQQILQLEIMDICSKVEQMAGYSLNIMEGLFPDAEYWEELDAQTLFLSQYDPISNTKSNKQPSYWEQDCFTLWNVLKDVYVFTPGMLDVLEETIDAMKTEGMRVVTKNRPLQ